MSASIGSTDHLSTNPCSGPRRSFYTFSHDRTIKRFPLIAFGFATCIRFVHCPSAFGGYFEGSLLLMLPQGFGDPIAGFANPQNETRRDTPHLTVGHTPWSTSSRGAFAFPSRGHRASTTATHGTRTVGGRTLFLYLFLFTGVGSVRVLGHGRGPVLDVVVWVDLDWRFGWTCDAPKVALPHLRRPWSLYWCA